MGKFNKKLQYTPCQEEVKEKEREVPRRPSLAQPAPDSSSRSEESLVNFVAAAMPSALVPVPPCTLPPSLSTSPLRSSSSQATLPVTTRGAVLFPVTSSWPSATTMSSPSSWVAPLLPTVACSPTFTLLSSP